MPTANLSDLSKSRTTDLFCRENVIVRRANLQIGHEIHCSDLEDDKSARKTLPPAWSDLFRPRNADFLSDIPSFAESIRISHAESETVARPFRRILLPQSRSLYSLHIRASANTASLLR
ncbi:hypothetical protein [Porphyromonas gingivalis]|uniref:hypothetical protein n=1 Tax=Porphyromonas gingivalis TaxID=837 RepID=UPI0003FD96AD|nr:hypothetical protein CLI77_01635 [Porphyromonas gingivalis]PDP64848.1 hypothetical protein CLI80_02540 [Porphyromonas gingivalis]